MAGYTSNLGSRVLFRRSFVRNLEAPDLFLAFLISAVGAILAIRFSLHMAGYPQLGGGGLHIAHMLWGGLLMLAALVVLLGFLNPGAQWLAAILGGIGWGAFIDELGKFITQDNNYFFQPTVALIYVTFVLLYVGFQIITRYGTLSDDEYEANAMRVLEDAVVQGLTTDHVTRVRDYLSHCRTSDPLAVAVSELLRTLQARPAPPASPLLRLHGWIQERYEQIVHHKRFRTVLVLIFAVHGLASLGNALLLTDVALGRMNLDIPVIGLEQPTFAEIGRLGSSVLSGLFVIMGIVALRRGARMRAYQIFKVAVIVSLLLTEFFVFLDAQFAAMYGFALNLLLLLALNTLIDRERELRATARHAPTQAAA